MLFPDDDIELEEDEIESETNLSEIDDTELMVRLEAKYGKITGDMSSEDEDPDYQSWTSIILCLLKYYSFIRFRYDLNLEN